MKIEIKKSGLTLSFMGKNRQDAPLHLKIDIDYVIITFILSAAFFRDTEGSFVGDLCGR